MKRILCLRFPNWPIQRLLAEQPTLRRQPLVLHQRDARRGEQVVACSDKAAKRGVLAGMPLSEAEALTATVSAVFLRHEPAADQAALEQWAERCEAFSPLVGWETAAAQARDYLLLDITGIGTLFGGEERLVQKLRAACLSLGYQPSIAVAETIGAARAVAGLESAVDQLLPSGDLAAALHPLPVSTLRLAANTVELLSQLGVTRIEQLRQLPRESLAARFGSQLLLRLDQAFGDVPEALLPFRPPPRFEVRWSLEYATGDRDILSHVIQRLLERLSTTLIQQNVGALRLECELIGVSAVASTVQVELFRPVADHAYLWKLLSVPLERTVLQSLIERLVVRASLTAPLAERQRALFAEMLDEPEDEVGRALAELIDRLTLRLGADAVVRPVPVADAVPELAFRYVPLAGQQRKKLAQAVTKKRSSTSSQPPFDATLAHQRPLFLLPEPHRFAGLRTAGNEPPPSFSYRGWQHEVVRHWGPERIETGWWRGRTVRRDYYRIETATGQRFWLFRTGPRGPWFLHGEF